MKIVLGNRPNSHQKISKFSLLVLNSLFSLKMNGGGLGTYDFESFSIPKLSFVFLWREFGVFLEEF
jgi:hypothetical protein